MKVNLGTLIVSFKKAVCRLWCWFVHHSHWWCRDKLSAYHRDHAEERSTYALYKRTRWHHASIWTAAPFITPRPRKRPHAVVKRLSLPRWWSESLVYCFSLRLRVREDVLPRVSAEPFRARKLPPCDLKDRARFLSQQRQNHQAQLIDSASSRVTHVVENYSGNVRAQTLLWKSWHQQSRWLADEHRSFCWFWRKTCSKSHRRQRGIQAWDTSCREKFIHKTDSSRDRAWSNYCTQVICASTMKDSRSSSQPLDCASLTQRIFWQCASKCWSALASKCWQKQITCTERDRTVSSALLSGNMHHRLHRDYDAHRCSWWVLINMDHV